MAPTNTGSSAENRKYLAIAGLALVGILLHLILRFGSSHLAQWQLWPLHIVLLVGGLPLLWELLLAALHREFGSDLLAGISIVTSVFLGEELAGALVVLMLSGGEALESYAVRRASSVLAALAKRMPSIAHKRADSSLQDVPLDSVQIDDELIILPHEICPVDGVVLEGRGSMDEAYLTGEPFKISKTPGSEVISGAINGDSALTIRALRRAVDSRYARIMQVMQESENRRPRMRRLGDQLGALYTPLAVIIALLAWGLSGDPHRFLAVLVVATPCPLLIAIPVAVIGSISLAAQRGIIIKNPAALEQATLCQTVIFDKTGTLTYGRPQLMEILPVAAYSELQLLQWAASLERFSKHPLSQAIQDLATSRGVVLLDVSHISEKPGEGLRGQVDGHVIQITSRKSLLRDQPAAASQIPAAAGGLECVLLVNNLYAGLFRFRDEPRREGTSFVQHLEPHHAVRKLMLISGDRLSEVEYLAEQVGITNVYASQSPEQKLALVREETSHRHTIYLGDGINDAPSLAAATVGIAFGQNSDITSEAADAVIMDSSLRRVDEFLHISRRMRTIALQSALGGMTLSAFGMLIAAAGYLPPVWGAVAQEVIDVFAVLNALRAAWPPRQLTDF
ncbi:MAG: heavy metal translocating P-type ATPase [Planctomycetales bacterium]